MMRIYSSVLALFIALSLQAQITVGTNTLPEVGDTLKIVVDTIPPTLDLGNTGGNNTWDFSDLQGLSSEQIIFAAASGTNAASFPSANQRVTRTVGSETYLEVSAGQQKLVGFAGTDPFNIGLQTVLEYNPAFIERNLPLNYEDTNTSSSAFNIEVAASALPPEILDQLSNVQIDSLRLQVSLTRVGEVDAWGSLTTPAGNFEVLREKRTEYTTPKLEVLTFLGWIDVTVLAANDFPALTTDTAVIYNFWSNDAKDAIAVIEVNTENETEVEMARYSTNDIAVAIPFVAKDQTDLTAYPNPAIDKVRFDFRNLPADQYKLVLYNILGQELWSEEYYVSGNLTRQVDITNLRKGTYLYSLVNKNEKTLVTKRLMVIRP